jgi:hypothetical protein
MFQTKVLEKTIAHILRAVIFFPENRAVYKKRWENVVEPGRPQLKIWRMRISRFVLKATKTRSRNT